MSGIPTRMVVHALVREDGTVAGGELYEVAGLLGMTDQQVRLCVKRLVSEGRFTAQGRGRRAVLRLAGAVEPEPGPGLPLVPEVEFVRHAYRQDRGLEPWDGLWHAFAFAVPESARAARDSLRDALTGLGAAPVQGGLYVTPNAIGPYVRAHAAELGLSEALSCLSTRDLTVGGTSDPRALAKRLWPLPEIAARYTELRALAEQPAGAAAAAAGTEADGAAAGLAHAVALAAAFSAAMLPDPLLPPELLPQPWPGATARAAASGAWARLEAAAPAPGPRLFRLYGEALA
ncbi:PaaX family transcriptional regulator C-terminal domain-containing protein [Streptomyces avidinii]|uniref:Phenylacetic acid degradation operon negative regulatory protein n=1 Tax=Streptomyces avidinii TaxID=1895 RepID=A0ABS4LFH9_STRAV|nr:PaaX family transcriptional regulator C-terminal domain-containing protein [Streptomyces avidinii]MBP2040755.1 phenylacetic acid degradation operon negative regulatory protein [Streptomyces avidinii]GGZ16182.1 putative repressor in the phenylacetic acid catabolism [Streptomyces avidinii]